MWMDHKMGYFRTHRLARVTGGLAIGERYLSLQGQARSQTPLWGLGNNRPPAPHPLAAPRPPQLATISTHGHWLVPENQLNSSQVSPRRSPPSFSLAT
jgi:hypothetical protein